MTPFGKHIRKLREAKGLSLRNFAKQVGVSPAFQSRMETGGCNPPSARRIITTAILLGVDIDKLLAMAGKVAPDVIEEILTRPKHYAAVIREERDSQ